jgi:hypothetical protein
LKNVVKSALILLLVSLFAVAYFSPTSYGVIQGHRPFVIQGHSPINLLVVDQSTGLETGCANGVNIVQIPNSTYSGCGTEPQSVNVTTPTVGTFTVGWTSTVVQGQGQFNVTITVCNADTHADSGNQGHPEGVCSIMDKDDKPIAYTLISETPIGPGDSGNSQFAYNSNGQVILPTTTTATQTSTVVVPTTTTQTATAISTQTESTTLTNTITTSSNITIPVTATAQTTIVATSSIPTTTTATVTETTSTQSVTALVTETITRTTGECGTGDPYAINLANAVTTTGSSTTVTTPTVTVTTTVTTDSTSTATDTTTSTSVIPTTSTSVSNTITTVIVPVTTTTTQTQTLTSTTPVTVTQTNTATNVPTTTITRTVTKVANTCYTDNNAVQIATPLSLSGGIIAALSILGVAGYVLTVRGTLTGVFGVLKIKTLFSKRS